MAFLTLPLTEQHSSANAISFFRLSFFIFVVSHDYRIKISSDAASILIFHQQLEKFTLNIYISYIYIYIYCDVCTFICIGAHVNISVCMHWRLKWSEVGKAHYGFKLAAAYQGPLKQPPTHCENFAFTVASTFTSSVSFSLGTQALCLAFVLSQCRWEFAQKIKLFTIRN